MSDTPATLDDLRRSDVPAVLTATAVARILGIGVRRVNDALNDGEIPFTRLGARRYIPRSAVLHLAGVTDLSGGSDGQH